MCINAVEVSTHGRRTIPIISIIRFNNTQHGSGDFAYDETFHALYRFNRDLANKTLEFSLNVFTEFSDKKIKIKKGGLQGLPVEETENLPLSHRATGNRADPYTELN